MNNSETLLNAETLHKMDSKSALSVIKVQFKRFINSDLLKPLDIHSRSFLSDREVKEIFRDYTTMTAHTFKETIIQNMNSIEQCIMERACHEQELKMTLKKFGEDSCSDSTVQELEAHYGFMAKIQEVLPAELSSTDTLLEQVKNTDEKNVFANERQHSEKHAAECADERVVKEEKDIDKMIEMDKQLMFLNEIVYTRNQSIQTIHMLAPKCVTYNGRLTFANPRFAPEREEIMTLENESRSKLNKDKVKPYDYTN
ncbi:hypothetical protein Tco_1403542 [Tanacetum coccineum]